MARKPQYRKPPRLVKLATPDPGEARVCWDSPNAVTMDGQVVEVLPSALFAVDLDDAHSDLGRLGGKTRQQDIRVLPGTASSLSRRQTTCRGDGSPAATGRHPGGGLTLGMSRSVKSPTGSRYTTGWEHTPASAGAAVAWREQSRRGKAETMATGTIRTLRDRGFGFIEPDDDKSSGELFFHHSAVANRGFEMLQVGQRVTFDVTPDPRDPGRQRAINVVPEGSSSYDE